jgi:hypothetical protein
VTLPGLKCSGIGLTSGQSSAKLSYSEFQIAYDLKIIEFFILEVDNLLAGRTFRFKQPN